MEPLLLSAKATAPVGVPRPIAAGTLALKVTADSSATVPEADAVPE